MGVPLARALLLQPNPELAQLACVDWGRRARERVRSAGGLWERDHVPDRAEARQHGHDAIEPERDPAQRGRTEAEGLEQEAEALAGLVRRDAQCVEDPLLERGVVDADRPSADLPAVQHHVVGPASP